jgi:hypothetical protein
LPWPCPVPSRATFVSAVDIPIAGRRVAADQRYRPNCRDATESTKEQVTLGKFLIGAQPRWLARELEE